MSLAQVSGDQTPDGAGYDLDPTALHLRAGKILVAPSNSMHRARPQAAGEAPAVVAATGHFVVQLDGPLTPARKAALEKAGVHLGQYLPMHAYIVRLPAGFDTGRKLGRVPFIRWVGPFDKSWKLDPQIGLRQPVSPQRVALAAQGRLQLVVTLFEGEDLDTTAAALAALPGVEVLEWNQSGENGLIELTIPQGDFAALADLPGVQWVEEAPEAVYRNNTNKWIVQSNSNNVTPVWDRGIHGENQVGGHIDGGVRQTHCSFSDPGGNPIGPTHRKIVAYFGSTAADSHGTHTAGTFLGDEEPVNGTTTYRGIAYMAKMAFTNLGTVSGTNLNSKFTQNHNAGARVHSNSWGDDGTTNYTNWARDIDLFSYNNEEDLVLFAITNINGAVRTPENAKNCLAVALTSDSPNQGSQCFSVGQAPTQDGRRKPELLAPGCSTWSSQSSTSCGFTSSGFSGTSMACPAVAGAGLLVRQYYIDGFWPSGAANSNDAFTPSGALIRATLINSGVDMSGISGFPSNREGWGRVLLDNALYFAGDTRKLAVLEDLRNASGRTTGQNTSYSVDVLGSGEPLKVTLVWTEKEATINANPAYINNLDLEVTAPDSTVYKGNVFTSGQSSSGGTADNKNNVEQVLLNAPATGTWTVTVKATAVNTAGPQGYALVVTGDIDHTPGPLAPIVTSIAPNMADENTVVSITDLLGDRFETGASVRLTRDGFSDLPATNVAVVNAGRITCDIDLTGAEPGKWTVVVTNPDTQSGSLPNGFTVNLVCTPGDVNNDGEINGDDIEPFTAALLMGQGTQRQLCAADLDGNGSRNAVDVPLFVDCLLMIDCPSPRSVPRIEALAPQQAR